MLLYFGHKKSTLWINVVLLCDSEINMDVVEMDAATTDHTSNYFSTFLTLIKTKS